MPKTRCTSGHICQEREYCRCQFNCEHEGEHKCACGHKWLDKESNA